MHLSRIGLSIVVVSSMVAITACSKQEKAPSGQQQNPPASSQSAQGGQSATTATQPASTSASPKAGQETNGAQAMDKYVLDLTDYANVPVTIKVNGQWVGQWDNHANIP